MHPLVAFPLGSFRHWRNVAGEEGSGATHTSISASGNQRLVYYLRAFCSIELLLASGELREWSKGVISSNSSGR